MDKNTTPSRERHGHHLAFGDDTDELDLQPVGSRLTRPQDVGAPSVADQDVPAGAGEAEQEQAVGAQDSPAPRGRREPDRP
jgi:hypothetical protein